MFKEVYAYLCIWYVLYHRSGPYGGPREGGFDRPPRGGPRGGGFGGGFDRGFNGRPGPMGNRPMGDGFGDRRPFDRSGGYGNSYGDQGGYGGGYNAGKIIADQYPRSILKNCLCA